MPYTCRTPAAPNIDGGGNPGHRLLLVRGRTGPTWLGDIPKLTIIKGYIDLSHMREGTSSRSHVVHSDSPGNIRLATPLSVDNSECGSSAGPKRRKVVGGLRLAPVSPVLTDCESDHTRTASQRPKKSSRQVHSETRFPQRKPPQEPVVPVMEPTSGEKLISGIWRQIFSGIRLTISDPACISALFTYRKLTKDRSETQRSASKALWTERSDLIPTREILSSGG
jgi:hypothetical protein